MRFDVLTYLPLGVPGRHFWCETDEIPAAEIDPYRTVVNQAPSVSLVLPKGPIPELRIRWSPQPDGTAMATYYAGPDDMDMITTNVFLPRGRRDKDAIRESLRVMIENFNTGFGLKLKPDFSDLPDGTPGVGIVVWPNMKHMLGGALQKVGYVEGLLASAYFLELAKKNN